MRGGYPVGGGYGTRGGYGYGQGRWSLNIISYDTDTDTTNLAAPRGYGHPEDRHRPPPTIEMDGCILQ